MICLIGAKFSSHWCRSLLVEIMCLLCSPLLSQNNMSCEHNRGSLKCRSLMCVDVFLRVPHNSNSILVAKCAKLA